ncbi:hypothetical protein [Mucilaginibacter sp. FT3.2]|uniref:hypothetical protein n=1 Tax=Mucilaginibacter sp. FT3.2 TaxID=2723090 RepID=UPI001621C177|nr:hypothetical protein [Mucilaginibacter sp. FT3.2]MBB6233385.1 hypothetical protein [Mucilaginibacter sp. FT3.2]
MDKELLHKNLIVSILALASDKQSQITYTTPGCVVCDLTDDFETYGKRCYNKSDYSIAQSQLIDELDQIIDRFVESGYECFDLDALDTPLWNQIRRKALEAVSAFGYLLTPLPKNIETQDGVWAINIANYQLKKAEK